MNFSNFRISVKLGIGFGVMVLLTALIGVLSMGQMGRMNDDTTELSENWLPSIKVVSELQVLLNDMRRAELQHVIAPTAEEQKPEADRFAANVGKLAALEKSFDQRQLSPEERQVFERYKSESRAYLATSVKLFELSSVGPQGLPATVKYLKGDSRVMFRALFKTLNEMDVLHAKGAQQAAQDGHAAYANAKLTVAGVLLVVMVIAALLGLWIARQITLPIQAAVSAAKEFAQGNLATRLSGIGSDEPAQLLAALESMRQGLTTVVAGVRSGSDGVATASAEIAQGNNDLSNRTEQQASALEQTAASMEQLGTTVSQNAESARRASELAAGASRVAEQGGDVVNQVVQTMKDINDSSKKIVDIISVIDGIAFQTNILALNAAVEAARAGEQGRGFAVVASEVRSLAGRSAEAAKEIKALINTSVQRVEHGSTLVDQAGSTMTEVVSAIKRVTDIMSEISAASNEQATGVAQVGEAVTQMDQATQQNAALVEQMAAAASSLKSQAQELVQAVALFKLEQGSLSGNGLHKPSYLPTQPAQKPRMAQRPSAALPAAKAAALKPRSTPSLAAPKALKPAPLAKSPSKGNEGDWETF
ncbi:MAG: methyl-accepting chemotaxis sensory transducer [Comamonadaceae bacterium]|nr:MAG: methyl-accepting chemotaxis sensory transducer [Comamonadaceae bacterium]